MRTLILTLMLGTLIPPAVSQTTVPRLPADDAIRIREFYRLSAEIQDKVWPGWSATPTPLLLVTSDTEFLTHHPAPPKDMKKVANEKDLYSRPRQFPIDFQATFPAFGPPSVIVMGEPANTTSKISVPWLFTLMHEHFHQLQNGQPGYFEGVEALGLSRGDKSGMWMLNYPFPYGKLEVAQAFNNLRILLLRAVNETDTAAFATLAAEYVQQRKKFFALLSVDDHKYFSFQLWQEGIARYTEIKAAEAGAQYHPTGEFAALPDFESFAVYAAKARANTLDELEQADLATWKRGVVYSFGAAEGLLLDRLNPRWKDQYFGPMFSTDSYFDAGK